MMMSRAYLGPWGASGIKVDAYGRGLGLGPVLSNSPADPTAMNEAARQALVNAGYDDAECHTEKVFTPDGNFYVQNICAAPGYPGGNEANLVLGLTPTQLAAQRAYELAHGAGPGVQDYFQMTAGAPNIQISNPTGVHPTAVITSAPDVIKPPSSVVAPQQQAASQVPNNIVHSSNGQQTVTPPVAPPSSSSSSFDWASLTSGSNVYYLLGAGAIAVYFMTKGKH